MIRATSTIAQALAAGYERVLCCAEIEEARALRAELPTRSSAASGRRSRIEGFDVGASPREFLEARAETLILTTTNGTRAILETAQHCDDVVLGSLLNLDAVAAAVGGRDTVVVCAGFQGAFALDDAYCAGRIVAARGGLRTDAAIAAELIARAFPTALEAFNARTYGPPGLEEDIAFCARENVLDVVPRLVGMVGPAAEIARLVKLALVLAGLRSPPDRAGESGQHGRQALALAVHADPQRRGAVQLLRQASSQRHRSVGQSCARGAAHRPSRRRRRRAGSKRAVTCSCTRWGGSSRVTTT